jgi:dienelactone hydrolase/pimeloyl-ACP methyl ester carboxylesterase
MPSLSRREFLTAGLALAGAPSLAADAAGTDVHRQLLDLAARQEERRRARFAAVKSKADLESLQKDLRASFLRLIGGLPEAKGPPPIKALGRIDGDDYVIEKLAYESLPGYFVSALLYRPKKGTAPLPGVLSPCGHSTTGKAADTYQMLHVNLAKRGYVVLTYDPVGQGERSQFWDAERGRSRYGLGCGEHAVLGNPLYLLGANLARYRTWDGMRGIDYLTSREEVDAKRIGCVGVSGGGTLTAYITALDPRVTASAICCYITTLPRRMANRVPDDPDADPEQDVFGCVSEGIDHAGLLALCAPRPTLLGSARLDFFPIEGARETFAEAKHLYEAAGAGDAVERVEADERHGLTLPLRRAVYQWFDRWLAGKKADAPPEEIAVKPRPAKELLVCADGLVNGSLRSQPLLPLALKEFRKAKKPPRRPMRDLLGLDPDAAAPVVVEVKPLSRAEQTLFICVNGNESRDWQEEKALLGALTDRGDAVAVVDPRGVGRQRPKLSVKGRDYADPLAGVEENIAYNAFLVGRSLVGMRVADVLAALGKLTGKTKPRRVVLLGRRDSALVACLAAAVEPKVGAVATEGLLLSYLGLFAAEGRPINAATLLPGLLRDFGDMADLLSQVAPRRVLAAAAIGELSRDVSAVRAAREPFSKDPGVLTDWLRE